MKLKGLFIAILFVVCHCMRGKRRDKLCFEKRRIRNNNGGQLESADYGGNQSISR